MKRLQRKHMLISLLIFIAIFLGLYISFIIFDYSSLYYPNNVNIKYAVVLTSLVFALHSSIFIRSKKELLGNILLICAMVCTVISDYFLLVTNQKYELGVGIFILAQLYHYLREMYFFEFNKKEMLISLFIRLGLIAIGLIVLAVTGYFDLLYVLVVIYFMMLVMNFLDSVYAYIRYKNLSYLLLAIGLLLFIGCDINVGLANIGYQACYNICWLFYAPSQVIIASTFLVYKYEQKEI